MLLETPEGFGYTPIECRNWMDEVGFCGMHAMRLDTGHMAIIGYRKH
jgi:hypothetical protein